jgi:hypothetical protein
MISNLGAIAHVKVYLGSQEKEDILHTDTGLPHHTHFSRRRRPARPAPDELRSVFPPDADLEREVLPVGLLRDRGHPAALVGELVRALVARDAGVPSDVHETHL